MRHPHTERGRAAEAALRAGPGLTVVALDYDGTVAVDGRPVEGAATALSGLAVAGSHVAIVTGRLVREVLTLAPDFSEVPGLRIYGNNGREYWRQGEQVREPQRPHRVAAALDPLRARIGDRHDAVVVNVNPLKLVVDIESADPEQTRRELHSGITEISKEFGLVAKDTRAGWELALAGREKDAAIRGLVDELGVRVVVFAGDDTPDLPAFTEGRSRDNAFFKHPVRGLIICSGRGTTTPPELLEAADLILDGGPPEVVDYLGELGASVDKTRQDVMATLIRRPVDPPRQDIRSGRPPDQQLPESPVIGRE